MATLRSLAEATCAISRFYCLTTKKKEIQKTLCVFISELVHVAYFLSMSYLQFCVVVIENIILKLLKKKK